MTGFVVKLVPDAEMAALLGDILQRLAALGVQMSAVDEKIAALEAKVAEYGTVAESAVTLLQGLSQMLADAKDDPAQIQAVIDTLDAQKTALAAAVVANTPSETPVPPAEG